MVGYHMRIWSFVADMNGDGAVTISDVWLWFKWLYFYPGDGFLFATEKWAPKLAQFFELSVATYSGGFSGVMSFFVWLFVLADVSSKR